MTIRADISLLPAEFQFLSRCYKFINLEWQHAVRESIPDQGLEKRFRESCVINLPDWNISQEREMNLGSGLDTASGIAHEVDIVGSQSDITAILEIKNRLGSPPGKNDVIVFFAKVFDYLACNSVLVQKDICLAFMSSVPFEQSGLAACVGLGIHPIAPSLRPLPILIDNARRINFEFQKGLIVSTNTYEAYQDWCAQLNSLSINLKGTWLASRCGYLSEDSIILKAVGALRTRELSQELIRLNADCTQLLEEFRKAKTKAI